jgi:DNA (cytosine-5)-methyltransferase 1
MGLENQHIDGGAGMFTLQPIALAENTIGRQPQNGGNGDGFTVGGPMYTLNATGVHGIAQPVYDLHGQDSRVTELKDVCNTVSAAYGAGGGNIPVTVQPIAFNFAPGKGELKDDIHITTANISKTIDASGSNPAMHQGGTGVVQPVAYAFAQNTRDEVRLINGDGQIVGALAASPGMKQTSYVAIAYAFDSLSSNSMKSSNPDSGVNQVDVSKTLDTSRGLDPSCNQGGIGVVQSVSACDVADTLTVGANQTTGFIGDVVTHPIVLMDQGGSVMNVLEDGTVGTLRRETHGHEPVVMAFPWQSALDPIGKPSDISGTLIKNQTMAVGYETTALTMTPSLMAVRRLTPVECERLQGFPDNHTNIPWRKKEQSPDGPRYKALGNSMAVPCMVWLGKRIQMVEDIKNG